MSGEKLTVGRVTVELSNTHKVLMRNAYAQLAVAPWAQESLRRLTA
jgi:hypothetical protein